MKHAHQTQFGRPISVVQTSEMLVDKWDALNALTLAADEYGLNHRTLGVLKALMTFHPDRLLSPSHLGAIVFPSNKTLADRLNGMPDSTLRRHIAKLVEVGIVSRHASANRKRFARRTSAGDVLAFGLDLSPIARNYQAIRAAAQAAEAAREALQALRARLGQLRQAYIAQGGQGTLVDAAFLALRRKADPDALTRLSEEFENLLETAVLSGPDDQNERHIEHDININSDSEILEDVKKTNPIEVELGTVLDKCTEVEIYFPERITSWHQMICTADKLTAMIGIDLPVFKEAIEKMGAKHAAIAVLCILQNLRKIGNPGGYLRRLSQTAAAGRFSINPMLAAL